MEYVNKTMLSINNLTDSIYEDLADNDYVSLNKNITELMAVLKEVQQSIKTEL
jgi:hypothetical protein